jgi:hypothetical protein
MIGVLGLHRDRACQAPEAASRAKERLSVPEPEMRLLADAFYDVSMPVNGLEEGPRAS